MMHGFLKYQFWKEILKFQFSVYLMAIYAAFSGQ